MITQQLPLRLFQTDLLKLGYVFDITFLSLNFFCIECKLTVVAGFFIANKMQSIVVFGSSFLVGLLH
jgi:hypothetical protein